MFEICSIMVTVGYPGSSLVSRSNASPSSCTAYFRPCAGSITLRMESHDLLCQTPLNATPLLCTIFLHDIEGFQYSSDAPALNYPSSDTEYPPSTQASVYIRLFGPLLPPTAMTFLLHALASIQKPEQPYDQTAYLFPLLDKLWHIQHSLLPLLQTPFERPLPCLSFDLLSYACTLNPQSPL